MKRTSLAQYVATMTLMALLTACGQSAETPDADGAAAEPEADVDGTAAEPEADPEDEPYFSASDDIELIVPFSSGGGTDATARYIAATLGDYLEGGPSAQVVNLPGGDGLAGTNEYAFRRDADGRHLYMSAGGSIQNPYLLRHPAVEYELRDFIPLMGFMEGQVVAIRTETGVESPSDIGNIADAIPYAGLDPGGFDLIPLLGLEVLGVPVDAIFGYEGSAEARLAFEQGESHIAAQSSTPFFTHIQPLIEAGEALPLYSNGQVIDGELVRDPVLEEYSTIAEVYEQVHGSPPSGELWDAYMAIVASSLTMNKILWVHRDAPEEAVQALRRAAEAMASDPDWIEGGAEVLNGYPPTAGDQLEMAVDSLLSVPEPTLNVVREFLADRYDVEAYR